MFIRNYEMPDTATRHIAVSHDLRDLLHGSRRQGADPTNALLLVWRKAFLRPELEAYFARPTWPLEMLDALPPSLEWPWILVDGDKRVTDAAEIVDALGSASGAIGAPRGSVHLTLELRSYKDRSTFVGGLGWWRTRKDNVARRNEFGKAFVTTLLSVLQRAFVADSEIFVEQLSIILSKDATAPVSTLTPTLHSDKYYGIRETAITSLLETNWEGYGGAMFMPTCSMDRLWHLRPITIDTLLKKLEDELVVLTSSGDILIYDGMIGLDGVPHPCNGIPHISPDVPGRSSRLGIVMYHRQRKACPREGGDLKDSYEIIVSSNKYHFQLKKSI